MLDDPRKPGVSPDEEEDFFDQDWSVPDDVLERNQSIEELGAQENQPTSEDDTDEDSDGNTLVPLWDLL